MTPFSIIKKGQNYGWVNWEGSYNRTLIDPTEQVVFAAAEYTHDVVGGNAAVIAGHFFRATTQAGLTGKYLAADHKGILWVMNETSPGVFLREFARPVCALDSRNCSASFGNVFSISIDRDGELYYSTSSVRIS